MMTEQAILTQQQNNVEKEALFPTDSNEPDEIVLTNPSIIPSENSHVDAEEQTAPEKTHDDVMRTYLQSAMGDYHAWLDRKVKSEIVDQLFSPNKDEAGMAMIGYVNIRQIADVLREQMDIERDRNFQDAMRVQNELIPMAELRTETVYGNPSSYTRSDVDTLWDRSEIHQAVADSIGSEQPQDEEGYRELAEEYIKRLLPEAREEQIDILKEQKQLLELRQQEAQAQIAKLEAEIDTLSGAFVQFADDELIEELTNQAKNLAV